MTPADPYRVPIAVIEPDQLDASHDLIVQVTSAELYAQAHIPTAVLVTPQELVCGIPPATGRLPDPTALNELFTRIGYTPAKRVVVYDDEGGGWAGRLGWTLDVIGHTNWAYLDGGLHSYAHAGLSLANGMDGASAANPSAVTVATHTAPIAEIEDVLAAIDDPSQMIWDVRSAEEHAGLRQAAARVGHIPGAKNFDWLGLKDPEQQQRLSKAAPAQLAALGIDGSSALITHCQTHHRSGLSYMWGRINGWSIKAYHGSWSEWGNRDDTPIHNPSAPQG
ncbi:MAG: rhodanese-like domain-containing protein [Pseudomonadota bacterium]